MRQQWSHYHAQGWLQGVQADGWVDGGAGLQLTQRLDLQYTFDAAGNRVRVTNYRLVDGVRIVDRQGLYAYDGAGRMTRGVDGASGAGLPDATAQVMLISLRKATEIDPTVVTLADMPLGWRAWRDTPQSGWQRARIS